MTTHTIACYFDGGTFHTSFNIPNADAVMNNQCRGTRTSGILSIGHTKYDWKMQKIEVS